MPRTEAVNGHSHPTNSRRGSPMSVRSRLAPCIASVSLLFVASAIGNIAFASDNAATTISALRKAKPTVRWNEESVTVADINCDGRPDRIAVGYHGKSVWVGFIPDGGRPVTMRFPIGQGGQDSFCSTPVHIETSPLTCSSDEGALPGCKKIPGCREFSVGDENCDSFHFYWHALRKELAWWRL